MHASAAASRETSSIARLHEIVVHEINQIIDPCSIATAVPAGLVDMGLLRDLRIDQRDAGLHVAVKLCVTHAFCMMPAIFVHEVEKRLRTLPDVASFEVDLDGTTLWSEELMSPAYRSRLAAQRASRKLA